MYRMTLGNGSGTDFGASQCIPMGPCLPLLLPLTLDARCGYSLINLWCEWTLRYEKRKSDTHYIFVTLLYNICLQQFTI